jgi:hypothetical protein
MASKVAVNVRALAVPDVTPTDWFSVMYTSVVLSIIISVAPAGTEIWYAGYVTTVAEPNVALLAIPTVAATAEPVVFATVKPVILLTVPEAGVKPASEVVPL